MTKPPRTEETLPIKGPGLLVVCALAGLVLGGGTGGIIFTAWLLKVVTVWQAYAILCAVLALSAWLLFREFETLIVVGIISGLGAMTVGIPKIPHFGNYLVGVFAGVFAVSMMTFKLAELFRKKGPPGAGEQSAKAKD